MEVSSVNVCKTLYNVFVYFLLSYGITININFKAHFYGIKIITLFQ